MNKKINIPEYGVSQFNRLLKDVIENNFDYVRIKGEISEIKIATKGQLYITLKDDNSILSGVVWDTKKKYLKFSPEEGMEVIVTGKITTWSKFKTTYQIDIDTLELAGEGALLKLIEDRKKRLKEKGFFDQINKKQIPYLPDKIGVITSPTGSVIYDIINRITNRFPTNIDIWPVSVQGETAAKNIIEAIEGFNSSQYEYKPDVIIIARGGGSTEDLMTFNDENLALSVFKSKIPIISAIGHETDTTIIDYVSDYRASTPTAAAEKAVPFIEEVKSSITQISKRLMLSVENNYRNYNNQIVSLSKLIKEPNLIIQSYKEKFKYISDSLFKELENLRINNLQQLNKYSALLRSPEKNINNKKSEFENILKIFNVNISNKVNNSKKDLNKIHRLLNSNSISSNLKKGYSIVRKSKRVIKKSSLISNDDNISIQFLDDSINIRVKKI